MTTRSANPPRATVAVVAAVALALLPALAGCVTAGRDFSDRPVEKIERGLTTKQEIEAHFGEPWRTGVDNGYESWTYAYNRWVPFGGVTRSKDLYIVFNRDGTVRAYAFNTDDRD